MWRTIWSALLMTACVAPGAPDTAPDKPAPRSAEQEFAPRTGTIELGDQKAAPKSDRSAPRKAEQLVAPKAGSSDPAERKTVTKPDGTPLPKAEQDLMSGISAYEDGDYRNAPKLLQGALDAGLLLNENKVSAHKYLAFMHCAQRRYKPCREEFRKALELDPAFELNSVEEGHPLWGPAFKIIKAETARRPQK